MNTLESFRKSFDLFESEWLWLRTRREIHRKLFHSDHGPSLLKPHGQMFWGQIDHILVSDIVMVLARMTDAPEISGKETLSLRTIFSLLPPEHSGLKAELCVAREKARMAIEPIRNYRDTQLAHRDRDVAEGKRISPSLLWSQIDEAVESVSALVQAIQSRVLDYSGLGEIVMCEGVDMFLASMKRLQFFDQQVRPRLHELSLGDAFSRSFSSSSPSPTPSGS